MKKTVKRTIWVVVIVLVIGGWMLYFHNGAIASVLPKWGWVQSTVTAVGERTSEATPEDEDPDNAKNEIPVHTAHVTVATLHRYIEGYGTVSPRPARRGEMAGSAAIAPPVAGVVAKILCQVGDKVHVGMPLIQLDDRLARAAEEQADAGVKQATASLKALQAEPRPDQLQIAQLAVDKSASALQFAQKNFDRAKQLSADQGVSAKSLEQASQDLEAAKTDLAVAQRQLNVVKSTPTAEDLAQEQAKVAQAAAALASARAQREMMMIVSPIDATVASVSVNPGEAVDMTRTLVQLVALDRLMVAVNVPADQLPASAQGLAAEILPAAASTMHSDVAPIIGKIAVVSPTVDPRNGSVAVDVDLPADSPLRPGLSVRVRIIAEEHKGVLAVPMEAVVTDENGDSVIATVDGAQATHKTVKVGLQENGLVEVTADGLKEGDTVVTAGAFGLPQATRVQVTN